jgi:predicted ribosome quality control (RQC) complex YloA/Tae2 family protein
MSNTIFRKSETSSGKIMLAGKDASSNEELIKQVEKNEIVLHTAKPGSPFVEIKGDAKEITKQDLKEAAIFCAKYSQAYKKARIKKAVEVHYFLGSNIFKDKTMPKGTFGVMKVKKIIVNKDDLK